MKGVDWSKIRKVLQAVELFIRVIIGYLHYISYDDCGEGPLLDGILCVPNSTARRVPISYEKCMGSPLILIRLSAKRGLQEPARGERLPKCR